MDTLYQTPVGIDHGDVSKSKSLDSKLNHKRAQSPADKNNSMGAVRMGDMVYLPVFKVSEQQKIENTNKLIENENQVNQL